MADSPNATLTPARRPGAPGRTARVPRRFRDLWPLAAVGAGYTLLQLIFVRPATGLGWDESVYVSQVASHAPSAFFSAPRARGTSLLVAPVAMWSSSTVLLRLYLATLSGLGLFLALRAWRGLFPTRVLVLGGALFATLWISLFYGPQAMPNLWVALGALACAGYAVRALTHRADRAALWGAGASAAVVAWMRPTDAVWTTLPLLVAAAFLPRLRHLRLLGALLAGIAAGSAQWVAEAFLAYGGLAQRLSDASRVQGGLGFHLAIDDQLRSLDGRSLCRPCTGALAPLPLTVWWYALPLLALLALAVALRTRRPLPAATALACATTAAVPYLFLIGYAAPRFLLPAYALLALPLAAGLLHVAGRTRGRWRPLLLTGLVLALVLHLAAQFTVLVHTADRTFAGHRAWARTATQLHRLGVRPPCLLTGHFAIPIAYYARCASAHTHGNNANITRAGVLDTAARIPVAALTARGAAPPGFARDWPVHRSGRFDLYVAPAAR